MQFPGAHSFLSAVSLLQYVLSSPRCLLLIPCSSFFLYLECRESALLSVIGYSHSLYLAAFHFWFSSCVPTNMSLQLIRRCVSTAGRLNATVADCFVESALRTARNTENGILPGLGRLVLWGAGHDVLLLRYGGQGCLWDKGMDDSRLNRDKAKAPT